MAREFIIRNMESLTLTRKFARLLVAVSGGADSVALLCLLREQCPETELVAAHFEHGIRGEASREDERFVQQLCDRWGVPLVEGRADVPALAAHWGLGLEEAARKARYAFLRKAMAQQRCEGICLAHHLDDQAETVLMHLLRGSGLHGLSGMAEESGDLLRPLLRIRRQELRDYLTGRGIPWREDETNQVPDNPRNALRLQALPALEAIYPGAAEAIARLSRIAKVEDDYVSAKAQEYAARCVRALPAGFQVELSGHEALIRRVCLSRVPELSCEGCEALMRLCRAGKGAMNLPGNGRAEVHGDRLYLLLRKAVLEDTPLRAQTDLGAFGRITCEPTALSMVADDPFTQVLDGETLSGAVVRTRRPGDWIEPLGMEGRRKSLSDYLIDRHVDRPLRDALPVVARGSEVYWAVGAGISGRAKRREGRAALRLHYEYRND